MGSFGTVSCESEGWLGNRLRRCKVFTGSLFQRGCIGNTAMEPGLLAYEAEPPTIEELRY